MKQNQFCRRLNQMLAVSGAEPKELASRLGVSVSTVNRWRNGSSVPDLYQFQALARFFGMPCEWFLNTGGFPNAEELAARLGLCEDTVKGLMDLADRRDEAVLDALDDAVYALVSAVNAAGDSE
ncbi:helix-turn-helix domain-containing protein [Pseudoflavonifractor sp. 524-17]|uniref:helix-turn-helix domain-containing protein n=1 Tax=Pseudoflavonifractor sp. 524-17 TaxID=2304577 RepID=UPI00137B293A|nr:helix-turn-helix transcriptional regulator [Pseudoflavonifractor sp. 524-17]NCE65085.1 helix-turn-helix domain-containing protein [Pseudoflavonifractor sp. 524-17]